MQPGGEWRGEGAPKLGKLGFFAIGDPPKANSKNLGLNSPKTVFFFFNNSPEQYFLFHNRLFFCVLVVRSINLKITLNST